MEQRTFVSSLALCPVCAVLAPLTASRTETRLPWSDGELVADDIAPSGTPRATRPPSPRPTSPPRTSPVATA